MPNNVGMSQGVVNPASLRPDFPDTKSGFRTQLSSTHQDTLGTRLHKCHFAEASRFLGVKDDPPFRKGVPMKKTNHFYHRISREKLKEFLLKLLWVFLRVVFCKLLG